LKRRKEKKPKNGEVSPTEQFVLLPELLRKRKGGGKSISLGVKTKRIKRKGNIKNDVILPMFEFRRRKRRTGGFVNNTLSSAFLADREQEKKKEEERKILASGSKAFIPESTGGEGEKGNFRELRNKTGERRGRALPLSELICVGGGEKFPNFTFTGATWHHNRSFMLKRKNVELFLRLRRMEKESGRFIFWGAAMRGEEERRAHREPEST